MASVWQWVFAVIGMVALIMAIPSFLQMFFGRPNILIAFFENETYPGRRILQLELVNSPILNVLLRHLGVRKEPAQEVVVRVEIRRRHNGELIGIPYVAGINVSGDSFIMNTSMPASSIARNVPLVYWDEETREAFSCSGLEKRDLLPQGEYLAVIEIRSDNRIIRVGRLFYVHDNRGYVRWMRDNE